MATGFLDRIRTMLRQYKQNTLCALSQENALRLPILIPLCSLIASVAVVAWLLWCCHFGLGPIDESFFLTKISHPDYQKSEITLVGYAYHPLYRLLNGDVVLLRQTNLLVLLALAWVMWWELFGVLFPSSSVSQTNDEQRSRKKAEPLSPLIRGFLSLALACGVYFDKAYHFTPNYYDLNKVAFLFAGIGMIRAGAGYTFRSVSGWLLIGIAGYVSFLAKPSSTAWLGMIVLGYLIYSRKFNLKLQMLALIFFLATLIATEIYVHSSLAAAYQNTLAGIYNAASLSSNYSTTGLFRLQSPLRLFQPGRILSNICLMAFIVLLVSIVKKNKVGRYSAIGLFLCLAFIIDSMFFGSLIGVIRWLWNVRTESVPIIFWQLTIWIIVGFTLLFGWKSFTRMTSPRKALFFAVLCFPHAYAFGSATSYLSVGVAVIFFLIVAVLLFLSANTSQWVLLQLAICLAFVSQVFVVVNNSMLIEYSFFNHIPPQREMNHRLFPPNSPSPIWVDEGTYKYATAIRQAAYANGFKPGDPIINLTGFHGGTVYLLDGYPVGSTILYGHHPGVAAFVEKTFSQEPRAILDRAWILTAPQSDIRIPETVLNSILPEWEKTHVLVGTFMPPSYRYMDKPATPFNLYKPSEQKTQ